MNIIHLKRSCLALSATAAMGLGAGAQAATPGQGPGPQSVVTTVTTTVGGGPGHHQRYAHHGARGERGMHRRGGACDGHGAKRMRRGLDRALWVPGYGAVGEEVVKSLELNAEQAALLDAAREAVKAQFSDMPRAKRQAKQVESGAAVDPHGQIKLREAERAKMQGAREEVTQKWLALWDALEPAQQEKVATALSERKGRHSGKRGHHHGRYAPSAG